MNDLNTYLISAPLSTLTTLLAGLCMCVVFDYYGTRLFKRTEPSIRALYFFAGLLVIAWLIWMLCLLNLASTLCFKIFLGAIIIQAVALICRKEVRVSFKPICAQYHTLTSIKPKAYVWLIIIVSIAYVLMCLAVPTDGDSMNYHLALPVDILNTGSLWFNKDMICFRMAGLGEMINTLGLANGCPQLSGFLQIIGMGWLGAAFLEQIPNRHKSNFLMIVAGLPVLLFLLPNQKNQLTGILCTTLCFFIVSQQRHLITKQTVFLLISVLLFAAGIKYSFIISAGVLVILLAWKSKDQQLIFFLLVTCAALTALILGPIFAFKWIHLGDPISPFFETWKKSPDPIIIKPFQYMRMVSESDLSFPLNLFFATSFGSISMVLGMATFSVPLCLLLYKKCTAEVVAVISTTIAIAATGQVASRFFIEPVLWSTTMLVVTTGQPSWLKYFITACRIQFLALVPLVLFGMYSLVPSLVSNNLRDMVLVRSAQGYAESRWAGSLLPPDPEL